MNPQRGVSNTEVDGRPNLSRTSSLYD